MSPPADEGCWALAGLSRFLEDQASLLRRHCFISVLIPGNSTILSTPATVLHLCCQPLTLPQPPSLFPVVSSGNCDEQPSIYQL